jgi:hypothetical protein
MFRALDDSAYDGRHRRGESECYHASMRSITGTILLGACAAAAAASLQAQRPDAFTQSLDHPAIRYRTAPTRDRVAELNRQIEQGRVSLTFDAGSGYLRSVMNALRVPVESQLLVFSETSAQAEQINMRNPRAVYFDDDVAIGWVRGAATLELAAVDPQQGVIFYTLPQAQADTPRFARDNSCLLCHAIWETHGVPGLQVLSTFPMADERAYAGGGVTDHRTPIPERWGGWFVTGRSVPPHHLGNLPVVRPVTSRAVPQAPVLPSVKGLFDLSGYPAYTSDIVALMVLEHQSRMTNLITWLGWEARAAAAAGGGAEARASGAERVDYAVRQLVDYMLFVDEAPLTRPVEGGSGFAAQFAAKGPRDTKGRSLRQLDLQSRLFRFRCSYMIDSAAFAALPEAVRQAIYTRLSAVLSGADTEPAYKAMARDERQTILDILRDTRRDLPAGFAASAR